MVLISGKIEDSGGVGLTGILRVTLDAPLIDTTDSPDAVQVPATKDFAITAGAVSVTLTQSETASITYRFQFLTQQTINQYFFSDGDLYTGPKHYHTDSNWYTGSAHNDDSKLLFESSETRSETFLDFHAIVPNQSTCEFASLLPTGITTDILDTSLRRLAEILTGNIDYVEALRGGPRFLGTYSPTTYYKQDDSVSYGGSSWIWIDSDPGVGSAPSLSNPNWQQIAQKGDSGGTGGQDTAYSSGGWDGATWAPAANAIRDKIETLAPLASPVFTGNPRAPLQLLTDEDDSIATTLYVADKIDDRLASLTVETKASGDSSTAPASTEFVKNVIGRRSQLLDQRTSGTSGGGAVVGTQTRTLNTIAQNAGDVVDLISNTFTLRAGIYWIEAIAHVFAVDRARLFLYNVSSGTRLSLPSLSAFASSANQGHATGRLRGRLVVTGNTDFQLRQYCETANGNGLGVAVGEASIAEIYAIVDILRID